MYDLYFMGLGFLGLFVGAIKAKAKQDLTLLFFTLFHAELTAELSSELFYRGP